MMMMMMMIAVVMMMLMIMMMMMMMLNVNHNDCLSCIPLIAICFFILILRHSFAVFRILQKR
jgi:uncharacterized membrane-anchored protein